MKNNKQGSMLDMTMVLVALFVFAFVTVLMFNVYDRYTTGMTSDPTINNTVSDHVESQAFATFDTLDFVYAFLLILFTILTVVSAFAVRSYPVFFVINIVMLVILVLIGAVMGNVYSELEAGNTYFDDSTFTIIPFIMQHFPTFLLVVGALLSVAMYAKSRWDD